MRHILFINEFFHPDICASAAVATDHLPRIAELRPDWRITVIAGNRAWDDPSVVYPATAEYRGVHIVRVDRPAVSRRSLLRRALGFAAFQRGAVRAARKLTPIDLVVATTAPPQGGDIARAITREQRCPYIYKVLDIYPDLAATLGRIRPGGFVYRRWLARDTQAMRDAALIVCIGERMTERLQQSRGLPAAKLQTIHDGFDPARIKVAGNNTFRNQHNPEGRFVVQYAGNMGLSHPFETILAAAARFGDASDILFQFIGDGPQRRTVEAGLPPCGQLLDYQPARRLCEVLATADVCLISQHEEMFDQALPYKIYATLAAGKPCIFVGSRRSEIAEWLAASGAGLHV
ncbi:MAG: glycosyltransferase family 4 protein, partial [Planctomycetota bacterium]